VFLLLTPASFMWLLAWFDVRKWMFIRYSKKIVHNTTFDAYVVSNCCERKIESVEIISVMIAFECI